MLMAKNENSLNFEIRRVISDSLSTSNVVKEIHYEYD